MTDTKQIELKSRLALGIRDYLTNAADYPFATLVSLDEESGVDILTVELEPELPQVRAVPIQDRETVRMVFARDDNEAPKVYSCRADFPFDLTHTNRDPGNHGVNLCVWEENWHDLARTLSAQSLIERIRMWFTQTAVGQLHLPDQALEPLLPALSHTLILPPGEFTGPWHVIATSQLNGRWSLVVGPDQHPNAAGLPKFSVFSLELAPQVHGALRERPFELASLTALVADLGHDLISALSAWLTQPEQMQHATEVHPLLLITVPLRRTAEGPIETVEPWAYTPGETLAEVGAVLGCTLTDSTTGKPITVKAVPVMPLGDLSQVVLQGWRVVQRLNRAAARHYAAIPLTEDTRLVAIGAGAIGSNVVRNTIKAGIGIWTIIDDDIVMPHNTVRQTQGDNVVGAPKAWALQMEADILLAETCVESIEANILNPGEKADEIAKAIEAAKLTVDLSASPAVLGHLADATLQRGASFFFNPNGTDLVVMREDSKRQLRLDEIEAQYFLTVATDPIMEGHLDAARVDRMRYANACQDLTRPLPPWQVQTLCGVAAGTIMAVLSDEAAGLNVWRLNPTNGAVIPAELKISSVTRLNSADCRMTISDDVLAHMQTLRAQAAPNETGGILLGSFDVVRNVIHIVAALPAPEDSRQSPTYFVRGSAHLKPLVDGIAQQSAGQLHYVGEWHSHPDGAAVRPSADDEKVFAHLQSHLGPTGSPYSMVICGKGESWIRLGWQNRTTVEGVIPYD